VTHDIPGRVRIRIPSKQRDASYFALLEEKLKKCDGIDALQANPLTGGVLMLHHVDLPAIAQYAKQNELFALVERPSVAPVSVQVAARFRSLDRGLRSATAGSIDLSGAAFVGLTLAGMYQLLRRNIWPAGLTLLWYATSVVARAKGKNDDRNPFN
jgi:hypothetical protein